MVGESKRSPKESTEKTIQPSSAIAAEQKSLVEEHYKDESEEEGEKHSPYEHPASTDYAAETEECMDNDRQDYYKDEEVRIDGHVHDYAPEQPEHEEYEREDEEKEQSLQVYDDENDEEDVEYDQHHASGDFSARADEEDENEEEAYGKPYKDSEDENKEDDAEHHVSDQTKGAAEKSDEEDDD